MILDSIVEEKKLEIARLRRQELPPPPSPSGPSRDFRAAIARKPGINLIAEIKQASPSRGRFREDFDPAQLAQAYQQAGAAALSVLTDEKFFLGHLDHLGLARRASSLPLLRKDFVLDQIQVRQTAGRADAILLIARLLDPTQLRDLARLAADLGLASLVEVHDEADLERALEAEARIIGINNRDLDTFQVNLDTTQRLRPQIPQGKLIVVESGIATREQVLLLQDLGVDAILVGEALLTAGDLSAKARELLGRP